MSVRPSVSFIVPVRNDARRLACCLQSIRRNGATGADFELIVADNGSTDGSDDVARQLGARVLSLPGLRVAELRNRAAASARGELVAFVDADHEIAPDWSSSAIAAMRDPGVGAAGAPYDPPAGATWVQRAYDGLRRRSPDVRDTDWLPSGNLVVRRSVFERLGGFDTTLEACEDVDFSSRLRRSGYRLVATPRLRSIHHGDPATLKALFFSELWRGRNNLKVSLRDIPSLRELPSIVIPIVDLGLIVVAALGLVSVSKPGLMFSVAALAAITALSGIRAWAMAGRLAPVTAAGGLQALIVAIVYDTARAIALTTRSSHDMRRRS